MSGFLDNFFSQRDRAEEERRKTMGQVERVKQYPSNIKGAARDSALLSISGVKPQTEPKPTVGERIFGSMTGMSFAPLATAAVHNAALAKKRTGDFTGLTDDPVLEEEARKRGIRNRRVEAFFGTKRANEAAAAAGYIDPATNKWRALIGRTYETGADAMGDLGVKSEPVKFVGGLAADILLDPGVRAGSGYGTATREIASEAGEALFKGALTAEKASQYGIDIAKMSPRARDAIKAGGAVVADISAKDSKLIRAAIMDYAGKAVEGTPKVLNAPVFRRIGKEIVGEVIAPKVTAKTAEQVAKKGATIAAHQAAGDATIWTRLAKAKNAAEASAIARGLPVPQLAGDVVTIGSKAARAAKEAGEEATRIGVQYGKRARDYGGILKIGDQTLIGGQRFVDDAAETAKRLALTESPLNPIPTLARLVVRDADALIRPLSSAARAGSVVGKVKDAVDGESDQIAKQLYDDGYSWVRATWAKGRTRELERTFNVAQQTGLRQAATLAEGIDDRLLNDAAFAIENGYDPRLQKDLADAERQARRFERGAAGREKVADKMERAGEKVVTKASDKRAALRERADALAFRLRGVRSERDSVLDAMGEAHGGALDADSVLSMARKKMEARADSVADGDDIIASQQRARQMVRAERYAAQIEGRAARYDEVAANLMTEAEHSAAAAEHLRLIESEIGSLKSKRTAALKNIKKAAKREQRYFDTIERLRNTAGVRRETAEQMLDWARDVREGAYDFERVRDWLLARGHAPEKVDTLITRIADQYFPAVEEIRGRELSRGLVSSEAMGAGSGSQGYVLHTDPGYPSIGQQVAESRFANTRLGKLFRPTEQEATMRDVQESTMRMLGREMPDNAQPTAKLIDDAIPEIGAPTFDAASWNPDQQGLRERGYKFLVDRIEAGHKTETNLANLLAKRFDLGGQRVGRADLQDDIVRNLGVDVTDMTDVQFPQGFSRAAVTRDGEQRIYVVSDQVLKWARGINSLDVGDEASKDFLRNYNRIQNVWKRMRTVLIPQFHARNLGSNYTMAWLEGLAEPTAWEDGYKIKAGGEAGMDALYTRGGITMTGREWDELGRQLDVVKGAYLPSEASQATTEMLADQRGAQTSRTTAGRVWRAANRVGSKIGEAVEDGSRLSVWFAAMDKGLTPEQAAQTVPRVLYDYSSQSLTPFERKYLKTLFPFYSWARNNIPAMAERMATRQGAFNVLDKVRDNAFAASGMRTSDLPEYQRDTFAMPIPGTDIIAQIQMPWEDIRRVNITRPQDMAQANLSAMTLPIKWGAELATGVDTFTGRQIEQQPGSGTKAAGLAQLYGAITGMAPIGSSWEYTDSGAQVVTNPFISKVGRELTAPIDALAYALAQEDDRKRQMALLKLFTGVSTSDRPSPTEIEFLRAAERARMLREQRQAARIPID